MRYGFLFALVAGFLISALGCTTSARNVNAQFTQEGRETRVYEVFGMDCPGCHGGLEKLVRKIPAVQEAEANWKKKRLVVTVRPGAELNDEEIYDAMRRANFTVGKRVK